MVINSIKAFPSYFLSCLYFIIQKYFKAISLNHKCLQAANQLDWSFTCPVRQDGCFVVDCGGGNHYWDWFLPNGTTIKTNKLTNCENGNYSYNAGIVVDNSESIEMKSSSLCPVFASINKGKVVIRSDPHNCILSYRANNCNFEPIYLNVSLLLCFHVYICTVNKEFVF